MTSREIYNIRAGLVYDLRTECKMSLADIVALFRLPTRDEARKLEARGCRLRGDAKKGQR